MLAGGGYVVDHLKHVHDVSWQYRWSPSAAPPLVEYQGRDYLRGDVQPALAEGVVLLGRTAGGGIIYGSSGPHRYALTVIDVVAAGRTVGYALSGGP